jgi:hypothetical protein
MRQNILVTEDERGYGVCVQVHRSQTLYFINRGMIEKTEGRQDYYHCVGPYHPDDISKLARTLRVIE